MFSDLILQTWKKRLGEVRCLVGGGRTHAELEPGIVLFSSDPAT